MNITQFPLFLLAFFILFLLPGAVWLLFFLQRSSLRLLVFEFLVLSLVGSITLIDFGMLYLARFGIPISRTSILSLSGFLTVIPILLIFFLKRRGSFKDWFEFESLRFSKGESLIFIGIFILVITFKAAFLWDAILPTSTDLGHHMYWAKTIVQSRSIPEYQKINVSLENGENTLTAPEPIDDFIIGEHLPFAAIALVSGVDFLSAFPSIFLLFANIATIFALSILAYRFFEEIFQGPGMARKGFLIVAFIAGPLWAISSPEAKYVSGGVIGNLLGNLFIPVIILSFFRALREKRVIWFAIALLFLGTLGFTHHLSTLVFLYISLFSLLSFIAFGPKNAISTLRDNLRILLSPFPMATLAFVVVTVLFIYTPTYLDMHAVDTALGSPSKSTREGLEFSEFSVGTGSSRLGLGLAALLTLAFSNAKRNIGAAIMVGWGFGLIIMSLFPGAVLLDIPSNRIGTYASFPIALLAGFSLVHLFFRKNRTGTPNRLLQWSFAVLFVTIITGGFFDNSGALSTTNAKGATQTYAVSNWLVGQIPENEWILKDHNYIAADSWMKLFFMRDYSYPLSRGYFRRYADDSTPREQCTLLMISAPNTPKGISCFESTGVSTVVVNPRFDSAQFNRAKNMSLLYASDDIAVYKRSK